MQFTASFHFRTIDEQYYIFASVCVQVQLKCAKKLIVEDGIQFFSSYCDVQTLLKFFFLIRLQAHAFDPISSLTYSTTYSNIYKKFVQRNLLLSESLFTCFLIGSANVFSVF